MKRNIILPLTFFFWMLACRVSVSSSGAQDGFKKRLKAYSPGFPVGSQPTLGLDELEESILDGSSSTATECNNGLSSDAGRSRREVKRLVESMDYRGRHRPKPDTLNTYISFRGAEEHSPDDLDLEGLFDKNYGGRARVVEAYKITPRDLLPYYGFGSKKYEYAAGATSRDRRYGRHKRGGSKIVLIITPKDFFADKNGKPTFLPSLALKINDNSRLSALVKMIHRLVLSAYPDITIERIRHLGTRVILNEAPQDIKISSLKIRNGSEISVTYKKIPKDVDEDETGTGIKAKASLEDSESGPVPDVAAEELPMTPVEPNFGEHAGLAWKEGSVVSIPEDEVIPEVEDLQQLKDNEPTRPTSSGEETDPTDAVAAGELKYEEMAKELGATDDDQVVVVSPPPMYGLLNETRLQEGDKLVMSDEGLDFIDQERAVEAEAEAETETGMASLDAELNKCSYRVDFRKLPPGTSNLTGEIEQLLPQEAVFSVHNISFVDLGPCRLETLVSEVNKVLESAYKGYSLARLEHKPSNRELLGLFLNTGGKHHHHHLLDLEIIRDDELLALLKPIAELKKNSEQILVSAGRPIEEKPSSADQCQVRMTIFVYAIPGSQRKDSPGLVNSRKKHAMPVHVCTHSGSIHINQLLEKVKNVMGINQYINCIFICGEKIIDSHSNHPVALVASETCVLRCDA